MNTPEDHPTGFTATRYPGTGNNNVQLKGTDYGVNPFKRETFSSPNFSVPYDAFSSFSVLPLPIYDSSIPPPEPPMTSPTRTKKKEVKNKPVRPKGLDLLPPLTLDAAGAMNLTEEDMALPSLPVGPPKFFWQDDGPVLEKIIVPGTVKEEEEDDDEDEEEDEDEYKLEEVAQKDFKDRDYSAISISLRPSRRKNTGFVDLRETVPPIMCCRPYKYILRINVPFSFDGSLNEKSFEVKLEEIPKANITQTSVTLKKKKKISSYRSQNTKRFKKGSKGYKDRITREDINFIFFRELSDHSGSIYDFNVQFFRSSFLTMGTLFRLVVKVKEEEEDDEDENDDREDDSNIVFRSKKFTLVARKVKKNDDHFWNKYPSDYRGGVALSKKRKRRRDEFLVDKRKRKKRKTE